MFVDDVLDAWYPASAAETQAGSAATQPAQGYAVRAGAGGLSSSTPTGVRLSDPRQQRIDAAAELGRAHFATLTVERVCRCGAAFRTLRFAPAGVPCAACGPTKPLPRPRRPRVVDDD